MTKRRIPIILIHLSFCLISIDIANFHIECTLLLQIFMSMKLIRTGKETKTNIVGDIFGKETLRSTKTHD